MAPSRLQAREAPCPHLHPHWAAGRTRGQELALEVPMPIPSALCSPPSHPTDPTKSQQGRAEDRNGNSI